MSATKDRFLSIVREPPDRLTQSALQIRLPCPPFSKSSAHEHHSLRAGLTRTPKLQLWYVEIPKDFVSYRSAPRSDTPGFCWCFQANGQPDS